jgi:hypothetical protein
MPFVAVIGDNGTQSLRATPPAQGQDLFENPHMIRYDAQCFTLEGRDSFIFSAAFHYPRCPKALWRDRLLKLQRAGFNTIETYVFWNYHEREEGHADLSEFEEFVELVKQMGFRMIARPGPYICAEWERGGIPHWVAAKRFPLRSSHPESIRTSRHWFSQVLPIIQRNQITTGGPIILVQVENEYDYWQLPDADKREYIRALARMAWNAGINVPLITCWTKQARENSDPEMARIMDTCNFYPRWNITKEVPPAILKLRQEEPASPPGVSELQGGWFSQFAGEYGKPSVGEASELLRALNLPQKPTVEQFIAWLSRSAGKLSLEQEGVDATQYDMLTKTAIEQGVTYLNTYMAFGGTNFDWGSKTLTTTYDYAAPLREPGGLWEKYYAARGIGTALALVGRFLPRAQLLEGIPQSTNPNVSVSERVGGKRAVVFVRENANAEQRFKMTFRDPESPTQRTISVPREGELTLGAREMKMLPVQIPIAGSTLRYSTAEVIAHGLIIDRHYLVVYDEPGRLVEISLASSREPSVEGDPDYSYWDPEWESVVVGVRVRGLERVFLVNSHLMLVVAPRHRALRSWTAELPSEIIPGAEEPKPMDVPFITDGYQIGASGSDKKSIWVEFDFLPGDHALTALLPPVPKKCRVDGVEKDFAYERRRRMSHLRVTTPPLPYQPITLSRIESWTEDFDPSVGEWLSGPARPLEELGPVPYGYVKYRAEFSASGQATMLVTTFGYDFKKVFLNGKLVPEASNAAKRVEIPISGYVREGTNTIGIAYEAFGSPHFGPNLGELKGIESARLGEGSPIETWQIQRFPAPMRGREIDPEFPLTGWQPTELTEFTTGEPLAPAFTWCRAEFDLPKPVAGWSVPWKLTFEAERDALLYLNGKFVGRYVTAGPQIDFYLPEPFFTSQAGKNVLTILLAYAGHSRFIRTLRISPYEEFATRRTRVEFKW